jgi:DNA-binding protein HU-beta
MNKGGLVGEIAKRTDLNRSDVARVVDEAMSIIRETVAKGERVALVGFGTFEKRRRNKRVARNPREPDVAIPVPARDVPSFAPGQAFKQAVHAKRRRASTRKPVSSTKKTAARRRASGAGSGGRRTAGR